MSADDPFRYDDAAYVLGALSDTERRAFERHMLGCAECTARVAEITYLPDQLRGLTERDFTDAAHANIEAVPPLPETLLPGLLRAAGHERRRRGWLMGVVASSAAAAIVALSVALSSGGGGGGNTVSASSMTALSATPVHASVAIQPTAWGTRISLTCSYDATYPSHDAYQLVVVDRENGRHLAGSWTLDPNRETQFVGGTAVPSYDIAAVEITKADDVPLLRYTP